MENVAQDTVIGGDKISQRCSQDDGSSPGADSGVDNHHVDCSFGEEPVYRAQNEGSLGDILRLNSMTDINELCPRIDTKYYPFHSSYIGIGQAKVRGQGYYGTHPHLPEGLCINCKPAPVINSSQLLPNLEGHYGENNK